MIIALPCCKHTLASPSDLTSKLPIRQNTFLGLCCLQQTLEKPDHCQLTKAQLQRDSKQLIVKQLVLDFIHPRHLHVRHVPMADALIKGI
jgi:hypothetical protein